ncbi:MAG: winged helix DNA-binding domain-containing protein [Solirubrobacteraceae bacterium]|nr:winged helix DNA-binding domain-containing protein [Solirubrobacteraceae bacterium]
MDALAIVRRRLRAQRLTGEPFSTPAAAVAASGAVQAQEHDEALWALATRVSDCDLACVRAACDSGAILRTHVLRPTWHFVAAADLRWLLRLTGPRVQAKNAGRYRELGLDAATLARVGELLVDVLEDGEPRIRRELAAQIAAAGIDTAGQRLPHMLMHAELEGLIASGPRRGRQHTYLLLEGRVPAAPDRAREDDVAELVLRYFVSHGPATLRDFAWWSGLTIADAKAGLPVADGRLVAGEADDGMRWFAAPQAASSPAAGGSSRSSGALLLGTFDETLVAYRDLRNVDADGRAGADLLIRPIVVDGRTVGGWTRRLTRSTVTIEAVLQRAPSAEQAAALQAAADRVGAFVGLPAVLRTSTS